MNDGERSREKNEEKEKNVVKAQKGSSQNEMSRISRRRGSKMSTIGCG
jgi:hypothetical protein